MSESVTYRKLPADQRRLQRRERLMESALDHFRESGYHSARIERICAQAGVSTRTFYRDFPDKQALLIALHDHINDTAIRHVRQALADLDEHVELPQRVRTLVTVFLRSVTADPRVARVAYVEAVGVGPAMEANHQQWFLRWSGLLRGEARNAVTGGQAPPRDHHLIATALVGAITGLLREWQSHPQPASVESLGRVMSHIITAAIVIPDDDNPS